jgi:hypothetical protein
MQFASAIRSIAAVILVLSSAAAGAADEPEAVYRKLHDATLAGNVDEMLKYASAAQRAELSALPERGTALKFLATMMPKSYAITSRVLGPDGKTARILATGAHSSMGRTEPMYGEISLRKEAGEWKVDQWAWSNDMPDDEAPAPSRPPGTAGGGPGAPKPAAAARKEPTLRRVEPKPECMIKPVMSDEDIERCRAAGR